MATEKTPNPNKPKPANQVKTVPQVTRDMVVGRGSPYQTR